MIVRILGEGQLEVPDGEIAGLNALDDALQKAIDGDDDDAFRTALHALLDRVRAVGRPLPADSLYPSELILPAPDAHVDEVRDLLSDEGLIPG
jgi:hypothetical protein